MKFTNALVVKLVDTKDLKAEGQKFKSVHSSPRQSKTSYKIPFFNLVLNQYKEIKLIEYLKTSTKPVPKDINLQYCYLIKKVLLIVFINFIIFSVASSEEWSVNGLLKDGYKITNDEIIKSVESNWGTKVVTLRKKNEYIVCTMIIDGRRTRPAMCMKP